jgi:hypothetical protein
VLSSRIAARSRWLYGRHGIADGRRVFELSLTDPDTARHRHRHQWLNSIRGRRRSSQAGSHQLR